MDLFEAMGQTISSRWLLSRAIVGTLAFESVRGLRFLLQVASCNGRNGLERGERERAEKVSGGTARRRATLHTSAELITRTQTQRAR